MNIPVKRLPLAVAITAVLASTQPLLAQEQAGANALEEIIVTGSLRSLPGEDVDVFGFGKSLLETPRSVSTISADQMERFNINDIDELVAFSPGTFTQSFFGVAGSLDIRGTPGETYFRGIRRVDNPGNYATPIAAADRVDIVRGPASPIYGPSKIGGYLNFNPKSARAGSGDYLEETTGGVSYTTGKWDRNVISADVGGPLSDRAGYYLYGEFEDSDSFYDNTDIEQTILQAAFDVDINDSLHIQFGAMYHDFLSNQVAGWNRLTQDLIDNGTYVTGTAQPLDTDGDGKISHEEYLATSAAGSDGQTISQFIPFPFLVDQANLNPLSALENPGTTTLSRSNVLADPNDELDNKTLTLYFDAIYQAENGLQVKNQLFYETLENNNENAYGFSQNGETWVFEEKLVFAYELNSGGITSNLQFSPSFRYTDFERGNDFENEFFDRRDLSQSAAERDPSLDTRLLSTQIDNNWSDYRFGDYSMWGLAFLGDFVWDNGLNITLGLRQDWVDMETSEDLNRLLFPDPALVAGSPDGIVTYRDSDEIFSWTVSVSWDTPMGLIPYATISEQSTVIADQMGDIPETLVQTGNATDTSELIEVGVKGSYLEDSLYFALSYYEQERTDFSAQSIVTNASTEAKGYEAELRWVITPRLVVTAAWTNLEITMVSAVENGNLFSFFGADDIPQVDPTQIYGGQVIGLIPAGDGLKQGIPENIFSATATYDFDNGFAVNASVIDVDSTFSGFSRSVELPAYTLVNAGVTWASDDWKVSLSGKNLTDEEYFRSNFPNLFGGQIVLPELPRHWVAKVDYRF
ncbi:TonB-dependent siderophore receptor [Chromatocurvus halotolerans]|uniref:Iron complex outermembrane receptor protein n=1 Tax=Chromatocurvus halotolerans TaxID=1132028 RepID=A0A4R2L451_9GAMM|nr:TonB-dependent receptor plug domain-containing protein [Chromatocurvus halotolerans]TCO78606.1 iron complex outermembrane receptor protein [Chromatocurvus halotolerans]